MIFGEKLQKLRKSKGMTQEQLAERITVSRQAISKWELGESLPDTVNILQISKLFAVSTDYLLNDEFETDMNIAAIQESTDNLEKSYHSKTLLITGSILGGIGSLGLLVMWVLSTMIESWIPTVITDSNGETWYSTTNGFSFKGFVEKYHLDALLIICCVCLIIGIMLIMTRRKLKNNSNE